MFCYGLLKSSNHHWALFPEPSREEFLRDYSLVVQSRAASEIGRREVLSGKAKFDLKHMTNFSRRGNEVAFGTIGNAACAEGLF